MSSAIKAKPAHPNAASLRSDLDAFGFARLPRLFSALECRRCAALWYDQSRFRKTVDMAPKGYGSGEYRYFADPLPSIVQAIRQSFYELLAPVANHWARSLGDAEDYPETWPAFQERCAQAGQLRPTPLMLRYGAGDYNRLHQDVYGGVVFPFQLVILLSTPGRDFDGGEFVLEEQPGQIQSRPHVISLQRGDGLVFPVRERPVAIADGWERVSMNHGISTVHRGDRLSLGVIFHDAE